MQAITPAGTSSKRSHRGLALALAPSLTAVGVIALTASTAGAADIMCPAGGVGTVTCEYSNTDEVGVFTVPAGVREIIVTLRGGEGGRGGGTNEASGGQGGAAGQISDRPMDVAPDQVLHVLLGKGGEDVGACTGPGGDGGASGGYDGTPGPRIAGGDGGKSAADYCQAGGGGGGSFIMKPGELPASDLPLLAAGGGGGGGGAEVRPNLPDVEGGAGGKGGPGAADGLPPALGGEVGSGEPGSGETSDQDGGGGGGGGRPGGGAGGQGAGGAGGCGVPETSPCAGNASIASTTSPRRSARPPSTAS